MSATVNGQQCNDAEITIQRYGVPWGRCTMADPLEVPAVGSQVLVVIASVTLLCTVIEAGERGGVTSLEFVGGYGGWRKPPPEPAAYRNDAGVSLAEAAEKLAASVGETIIASAAPRTIGAHLAIAGGPGAPPAAELLSQLCGLPEGAARLRWYVDLTGGTRIGERLPLPEIDATEVDRDPRGAWVAYAEEDALLMLPGATVGAREIAELRITATPTGVREVVTLAGDDPQSLAAKFWTLIRSIVLPWLLWRTVYTYRVTRVRPGNRPDLVPVSSRVAPALEAVRIWPGVGGNITKPKAGAKCLVAFADGNPNAPVIVAWQPQLANGDARWKPERADYDADLVALANGSKPAGRGGATFSLLALPPAGPVGNAALSITSPDGVTNTWTISASGLVVTPPVPPMTNPFTIDSGAPKVLV